MLDLYYYNSMAPAKPGSVAPLFQISDMAEKVGRERLNSHQCESNSDFRSYRITVSYEF